MTSSSSTEERVERPRRRSVLIVGVIFIVLGSLDIWRGVAPLFASAPHWHMALDDVEVLAIGIAALVGGIYVIRGANWARWLLAVWMVLHVAISVGQPTAFVAHLVIFGCIAFLLFRSGAAAHFAAGPRG
jgi:hypothetical protein